MQGERTGDRERQKGGEADGGTDTVGRTVNGAARLVGQPGQVVVPAESRADVSAHRFWKRGTTVMFDIRIVNLGASSYLRMTPEKALARAGARIEVDNSNVEHRGGPPLPESVVPYVCPQICRYYYLSRFPY